MRRMFVPRKERVLVMRCGSKNARSKLDDTVVHLLLKEDGGSSGGKRYGCGVARRFSKALALTAKVGVPAICCQPSSSLP